MLVFQMLKKHKMYRNMHGTAVVMDGCTSSFELGEFCNCCAYTVKAFRQLTAPSCTFSFRSGPYLGCELLLLLITCMLSICES